MHELSEIMILLVALGAIVWQAHGRIASQRALQRLAQREQQQHRLVRETSWALRNTLTIARGHIELIHNSDVGGSVHADTVVALEELDRIGSLASDLLIDTEHEPFEIVS
jgi:nitrogen-specific signal transduction histidine kinase